MSTEDNKALDRRFIEELFHRKNLAAIDELCTPDLVIHSPIRAVEGVQAYKQFLSVLLAGFSNMQVTIEDQFAEGDRSALRYAEQGTYRGFLHNPPKRCTRLQSGISGSPDWQGENILEAPNALPRRPHVKV